MIQVKSTGSIEVGRKRACAGVSKSSELLSRSTILDWSEAPDQFDSRVRPTVRAALLSLKTPAWMAAVGRLRVPIARHWPTGLAREADAQVGDGGSVSHTRHTVAPPQQRDPATTGPAGLLPALPKAGQDCAPNGLPTERGHQARNPVLVSTDRWLIELEPNRNGGW